MFHVPSKIPSKLTSPNAPWVEIISPNDGKTLTQIQFATNEDIESLLVKTKDCQIIMASLKPFERSRILREVAGKIKDNLDHLAWVIACEGGKPLKDSVQEVSRAALTLELCAEETLRLEGEVIPMERTPAGVDHIAFTMRGPIGAVLAISAFNHPLNLIAHQVGCAIGSGCSVVLKPAPATPLSAYYLEYFFTQSGLPEGCLRVIHASIPQIQTLVSSPSFDFVSFIGSANVGWELRKLIAPGTRLSLEHGGHAPAIVGEDADLELAAKALTRGAFYHAGQVCISTQIIYTHKNIYDQFVDRFRENVLKLVTGPATDPTTDVGPLIRPEEVKRLESWIDEALKKGAKLLTGHTVSGNRDQYLSPTVLLNTPRDCRLIKEEAFGPVVSIISYDNEEELLRVINQSDFIFEASLFTKDISRAMRIAKDISTMTFVINNHTAFRVDHMPFGGHKKSGLGMGGVRYAMEEMTRVKQVIVKI
jgi:acyl-CoA reductase-like NAD-dependent aldehyde dehydrogenase